MKILCVIDSLGSGGAQRQMVYLAKGLKRLGYDVDIFLYYPQYKHFIAEVEQAGIRVIKFNGRKRRGFSLSVLLSLILALRTGVYGGAISFLESPNIYLELARVFSPRLNVIVSERSSYTQGLSIRKERLKILFHRLANAVVANSHDHSLYLKSHRSLKQKCHVIWNGYPIHTEHAQFYRKIGSVPRFLVVGRVSPEKNGLRIIEACARYLEIYGESPCIHWAGRFDDSSSSENEYNLMNKLLFKYPKVKENWTWLGEISDMSRLYRSYDCLIHVSLFEGLPNTICEAMIYGCPVIASNICDHPKLIGQNERGRLCDPYSLDDICEAIRWFMLSSVKQRKAVAISARHFAEAHLSLETMVAEYDSLIKKRRKTKY